MERKPQTQLSCTGWKDKEGHPMVLPGESLKVRANVIYFFKDRTHSKLTSQ